RFQAQADPDRQLDNRAGGSTSSRRPGVREHSKGSVVVRPSARGGRRGGMAERSRSLPGRAYLARSATGRKTTAGSSSGGVKRLADDLKQLRTTAKRIGQCRLRNASPTRRWPTCPQNAFW